MTLSYPPVMSTHEAQAATARLHTAMQAVHESPALLQNRLRAALTQTEYDSLTTITAQKPHSPHELTQLLSATLAAITTRPVLELQIAFEPSYAFVTGVHHWIEQHGPTPCQVLWRINSATIGGLLIGWKGKRYDYCLATKLDSYEQFPEIS